MTNEELNKIADLVVAKLTDSRYSEDKIQESIDKKFSEDTRLVMIVMMENKMNEFLHRLVNCVVDSHINVIKDEIIHELMNHASMESLDSQLNRLERDPISYYGSTMDSLNKEICRLKCLIMELTYNLEDLGIINKNAP